MTERAGTSGLRRHTPAFGLPWPDTPLDRSAAEAGAGVREERLPLTDRGQAAPHLLLLSSAAGWRGSAVSILNIAAALDDGGWRVSVLGQSHEVAERLRWEGLDAQVLGRGVLEAPRLRRYVQREGVRVVMTDRPHDLRVAARALPGLRTPIVHRYNLSRPTPPQDVRTRFAYRWRVAETVFLTAGAQRRVLDGAPYMKRVPSRVIPEGLDPTVYRRLPAAADAFRRAFALGDAPFVLAVGALAPEKRHDFLLQAMADLGPDAPTLVVCGSGEAQPALAAHASALGVRVRWLGDLTREELIGAYSAAQALVHGCAVETFGLAVLEAMAAELPVVVPDGGALPEVVGPSGECGFLTRAGDPRHTAQQLWRVLHDRGLAAAMGRRGRARVSSRFSMAAMAARYRAVCEAVLGQAASARTWAGA